MIEYINHALSFSFIIDLYIPFIVRVFLVTCGLGVLFLIGLGLYILFNNKIGSAVSKVFSISLFFIFLICAIFLFVLIAALPMYLCIVSVKMFLLGITSKISEIVIGIIATLICVCVYAFIYTFILKSNTN